MENKIKSTCVSDVEIKCWEILLEKCEIVFDVGCREDNIFYDLKPDLNQIHLFDPTIYNSLLEKIKDKKNIKFNSFALGNENSEKYFYYQYGSFVERKNIEKLKNLQEKKLVKIKKSIDYINENNIKKIDFLKIDAEGFEFEVIKGFEEFIDNVTYIQIEDFNNFYNNITLNEIFDYFSNRKIYIIGGKPVNYLISKLEINFLKEYKYGKKN